MPISSLGRFLLIVARSSANFTARMSGSAVASAGRVWAVAMTDYRLLLVRIPRAMMGSVSPASIVTVSRRAADRLRAGHVWVYRSDIEHAAEQEAGLVPVADYRGLPLGSA